MKKILFIAIAMFLIASCAKENNSNSPENTDNTEEALVQKPITLQAATGEQLSVTYLAEGERVAVKIEKPGEPEQKLSAKTLNKSGNPIFTNDNYMWEFTNEGQAGKLSDKAGNTVEYFSPEKAN